MKCSNDEETIIYLNKKYKTTDWFVCYSCNKLIIDEHPTYLDSSKWGEQRSFCSDCYNYCETCKETYSDQMSYRHKDCNKSYYYSVEDEEEDENFI